MRGDDVGEEEGEREEPWAWAKELDINFSSSQIFWKICLFRFGYILAAAPTSFNLFIGMDANKQHHNRVDRYECIRRITALS